MFNPLALLKFKNDPKNPEMMREFLKQIGKLSPEERVQLKSILGAHFPRKISADEVGKGFGALEHELAGKLSAEELSKLKEELISFFS